VSASVDLLMHHEVQKFSLAPAHPGGPAVKRVVVVVWSLSVLSESNNEDRRTTKLLT